MNDVKIKLEKTAKKLSPKSILVGSITVDLAQPDGTRVATLSEALQVIGEQAGRDVALIVDEAQHALQTKAGLDGIFALKAARAEKGCSAISDAPAELAMKERRLMDGNTMRGISISLSHRNYLARVS